MPPLLEKWYRRAQSYFTTIFSWNCRERSSKTKLYSEHVFALRTVSAVNPELHRMRLENRHTQKNPCCTENLTLNLQTIFQKCENTNPSHSHSRLWWINLYGHRDSTQTPHRKALNQTRKLFCCEVTVFTAAPLWCPFTRPHISFNYSAEDWLSLVFNTWVWFASHRVCLVSTLPCIF